MNVPVVLHVVVHQAEDLPGQWVAHVLDFNVITQGLSPEDAIDMAREAAQIVVEAITGGDAPIYHVSPLEDWGRFLRVCKTGSLALACVADGDIELACLLDADDWHELARWVAARPRDPAPAARSA